MFDRVSLIEWRFKWIAQSIKPFELQCLDEEPPLSERELFGELCGRAVSSRFLGYYSRQGLERALEAYGIYDKLREKGFSDFQIDLDLQDPSHHRIRLYAGSHAPENLLLDFSAHLGTGRELVVCAEPVVSAELLVIDWLMLQNPRVSASPHELLPGQNYPGLGIGVEIGAMIGRIARRLHLDGCLAVPAWFHNAVLYAQRYSFVEPVMEGRFRAFLRDTAHLSPADVSWAIELGCVYPVPEPGDQLQGPRLPIRWEGRNQVWPLSPSLEAFFENPAWKGVRDATLEACHYTVDLERLRSLRAEPSRGAAGRWRFPWPFSHEGRDER